MFCLRASSSACLAARLSRWSQLLKPRGFSARPVRGPPPPVPRDPKFATLTDKDVSFFESLLGSSGIVQDADALEPHNTDWMRKYQGHSKLALKPKDTEQVAQILRYCNGRKLAVVPQGGNTGLVGGSVPVFDEVVVSLSNMNKIVSLDEVSGVLVAEAGCVLESLSNFLEERGYIMPLDLGAKGSCQIGGNVATNAGGIRFVRYGSLRGTVLGLKAVTGSGDIIDTLTSVRKDNTGYDLKQLFIGSEGSLGIITGVSILCPVKPKSVQVALLACSDYNMVCKTFIEAKKDLGEVVSAVEFFDKGSLDVTLKHIPGARDPMPSTASGFYVLIETSGSNKDHDQEKLNGFLEKAMTEGLIQDGVVAQDTKHAKDLWRLREGISESLGKTGFVYKYDLSVPVPEMYSLVEATRDRLKDQDVFTVGYGHIGDGNLHLNTCGPAYDPKVEHLLEPWVYEWTAKRRGSVSAEHGLGLMKADDIYYSKPQAAIDLMATIKTVFDPNGILNPYKVLPRRPFGDHQVKV